MPLHGGLDMEYTNGPCAVHKSHYLTVGRRRGCLFAVIVFLDKPRYNQIIFQLNGLLQWRLQFRDGKFIPEGVPLCRIGGLQKGDIDKNGIVYFVILKNKMSEYVLIVPNFYMFFCKLFITVFKKLI